MRLKRKKKTNDEVDVDMSTSEKVRKLSDSSKIDLIHVQVIYIAIFSV